jgi:hypothetical protein
MESRMMEGIVETIALRCFDGVLPPRPDIICQAVMGMPWLRDADAAAKQWFKDELYTALVERILAQRIAAETEFPN